MAYLDEEMGPDPFWTDERLLAYRLFVTNNPGDEDRAMSALGFDPERRDVDPEGVPVPGPKDPPPRAQDRRGQARTAGHGQRTPTRACPTPSTR